MKKFIEDTYSDEYINRECYIIVHDAVTELKKSGEAWVFNEVQLHRVQNIIKGVPIHCEIDNGVYIITAKRHEIRKALIESNK